MVCGSLSKTGNNKKSHILKRFCFKFLDVGIRASWKSVVVNSLCAAAWFPESLSLNLNMGGRLNCKALPSHLEFLLRAFIRILVNVSTL